MDCEQFDDVTRWIASRPTRRSALIALAGAALLGIDPSAARALRKRRGARRVAAAAADQCFPGTNCTAGRGKNASRCDFSLSTALRNRDMRASNLSNSSFRGADLTGADFRGANVSGSCFVSADLTGAKLGASVNLSSAIFCNTVMPDGSLNDSGCDRTTACCPPLELDCPTVDVTCYLTDSQNVCQQPINGFPSVGHCGRGLACCPCDHPDVDYWTNRCNQTFPACEGKCKAVDGGTFLECWSGCIL